MANHVTIVGSLVNDVKFATYKKADGQESLRGNFTVAQNQSVFDRTTNEYKNIDPIFWNLVVFDSTARSLEKSNIPKGSPLLIQGELTVRENQEYTDRNGTVHPKSVSNEIRVVNIGSLIGQGRSVTTILTKNATGGSTPAPAPTPTPAYTAPAPTPTPAPAPTNDIFGGGNTAFDEDDIFG